METQKPKPSSSLNINSKTYLTYKGNSRILFKLYYKFNQMDIFQEVYRNSVGLVEKSVLFFVIK